MHRAAIALVLSVVACSVGSARTAGVTPASVTRPVVVRRTAVAGWLYTVIDVVCSIGDNGRASRCTARDPAADPAFASSVVEFMQSLQFMPPVKDNAVQKSQIQVTPIGFLQPGVIPSDVPPQITTEPPLRYPPTAVKMGRVAVQLTCDVELDGDTSHCAVRNDNLPAPFLSAALDAAVQAHYLPAWKAGHPVREASHAIYLVFRPPGVLFPNMPAPKSGLVMSKSSRGVPVNYLVAAIENKDEGEVLVLCDLGNDGINRDYAVAGIHGNPAFGPPALASVRSETEIATLNGVIVAVPKMPHVIRFQIAQNRW